MLIANFILSLNGLDVFRSQHLVNIAVFKPEIESVREQRQR